MEKNSRIYIAGHRGLVGSAIVRKLLSLGYENLITFSSSELDLRDKVATESMFEKYKPEYVVVAAAKVGGILANNSYKADFIYDNTAISMNVIHSAYLNGVTKLVNLGSSCIYPKFAPQPLKEEYLLTGELEPTNEPYAIAKITALKMCNFYYEQHGCNFFTLMPPNLYGPGDNYNLETSHVLPAFIRKFKLAKLLSDKNFTLIRKDLEYYSLGFGFDSEIKSMSDSEISVALLKLGIAANKVLLWGTGEIRREFEHSDDIASAVIYSLQNLSAANIGSFINIGYGEDIKISDLANMIAKMSDYKGEIAFAGSGLTGTPVKLLDNTKAKALGIEPKISLEEGIMRTINDYAHA